MGVIYKITNPNGRVYVGKTYNLPKRVIAHKSSAKAGKNIMLHNSIRKYGWNAHVLEVIEDVLDDKMDEREIFWITELKTYCYEYERGLNMTKGGDGQRSTWMHRIDLREKQSKRFSGKGNPFYGKSHTEEHKVKSSKRVSEYNKSHGIKIPLWGVEKGRLIVMKPVLCYDKNGIFVNEFPSYTEAAIFIGVNQASRVWESVSGRRTHCNGWHFRDKTNDFPLLIDVSNVKQQNKARPVIYLFNSYKIEYPNATEASKELNIPRPCINRAAREFKKLRSGHLFIYKDLYEQKFKQAV